MKNINSKFSKYIIKNPKKCLFLGILGMLTLLPGILRIKSEFSIRMWYKKSHPEIKKLDLFEKKFGSDFFTLIAAYHPEGIFKKEHLNTIQEITNKLWLVPNIIRVNSITNHYKITSFEDEIQILPLVDEQTPLTDKEAKRILNSITDEDKLDNTILSEDRTTTLIFGYLKPSFKESPKYKNVVSDTQKIIDKYQGKNGIKLMIQGPAAVTNAFQKISFNDNKKILPLMFLFIIILLSIMFRNFLSVFIPLSISIACIGVTFGLLGILNMTYSSLLAAIPGILLAICIADSVHILKTYHQNLEKENALEIALTKNFWPTILTTLSTCVSFFSISFTEILPINQLGILSGLGTIMAWFLSYLTIGPIFTIFPLSKKNAPNKHEKIAKLDQYVTKLNHYKRSLTTLFLILTSCSLYFAFQNEVNSDHFKFFDNKVPIKKDYNFLSKKIKGMREFSLVVDLQEKNGITNFSLLNNINSFIDKIKTDPTITSVRSILDQIKMMNQILNSNNKDFYKIPQNKKSIAEILLLYRMGLPQGMDTNNMLTIDERFLKLNLTWKLNDTISQQRKLKELISLSKKYNIDLSAQGSLPLYVAINDKVVSSFFTSIGLAIFLVSLIILFVFKDFKVAFLSMIPNLTPIIIGLAAMYLSNTYIDIGTSIVCSICLGIAVDDTIHFLSNYKFLRKEGISPINAIKEVIDTTGRALIATTMLLVFGFGVFIFADFVPNQNFGLFCSIILLFALIADLIFLPAILLITDKEKS